MDKNSYSDLPHKIHEIRFETGQFSIVGDLILPEREGKSPVLIVVWGSGPAGRFDVSRPSKTIGNMLAMGFGLFYYDKPGSGESTGTFSEHNILYERALILRAAIDALIAIPGVNPDRIGFIGGSQAGYVMAMAIDQGAKANLMVAVCCPAQDSFTQSAYLVSQQVLHGGYSPEETEALRLAYIQRGQAKTYEEYLQAAELLDANPIVRDEIGWGGILPEQEFTPFPPDHEYYYDPMETFASLTFPVLAIFGEKDTQVDPVQGAEAFQGMLVDRPSSLSSVVVIPNADHNMMISETGSMKEQRETYDKGAKQHPDYQRTVNEWLKRVSESE